MSRTKTIVIVAVASIIGIAVVTLIGAGVVISIRHERAAGYCRRATQHEEAGEWRNAVECLEKARELGFSRIEELGHCNLLLANAHVHVGEYKEALDAAYRSRQIAEKFGDSDAPEPYLMMARALSYRYAETGKDHFRDEAGEELALYLKKAAVRGHSATAIRVRAEATKHRIQTGELITEELYIKRNYPSE